jgi:hypothetical protein
MNIRHQCFAEPGNPQLTFSIRSIVRSRASTVMEQETIELWHRLCVRAMNEPDLKCLMYVLQELNVVLIREEKAIKEEMKQDSHSREHCRKTATKADREYKK